MLVTLPKFLLLLTPLIGLLVMKLNAVVLALHHTLKVLRLTLSALTVLLVFKLFAAFLLPDLFVLVLVKPLFMLTMTRRKRLISGFIGRKFTNPEVAAIIADLDLLPEVFITPMIVEQFRSELRAKMSSELGDPAIVRMLVEACWQMLSTDYGKKLVEDFKKKFSYQIPFNRSL